MHLLEPGGRKFVGLASPPEEEGADVAISPASSPHKPCSLCFPGKSNPLGATVGERKAGQWKILSETDTDDTDLQRNLKSWVR